jgi:hypothetical protein
MALAKYEKERNNLTAAMQYAQKAVAAFPDSPGGHNAGILIKEISQKALTVTLENLNIPDEPILALLQYRNIKNANYKIYPLTEEQYKQYLDNKNSGYNNQLKTSAILSLLKNLKSIHRTDISIPDPQDYASHSTEFKIASLTPGNYLLWMEDLQSADSSLIDYTGFKVTGLSYLTRAYPDGYVEIRVMNRKTGEPFKNVAVKITLRGRNNSVEMVKTGLSDLRGMCRIEQLSPQSYRLADIQLISFGDTLSDRSKYIYGPHYIPTVRGKPSTSKDYSCKC